MQTRRNFLSLTAMAAVATALPSAAAPRPNKGKYQVVLLGRDANDKVVDEDYFFFDAPPTEGLKLSHLGKTKSGSLTVWRIVAPRRRHLVTRFKWSNGRPTSGLLSDIIYNSIDIDSRIVKRAMLPTI